VTIRDLLTHTSGLSYHFLEYGPVEELYRETRVWSPKSLAEFVDDLAALPLAFQPGTAWRYSYGHDVVARLVEIISGQPFGVYLRETLFAPLGMVDTGFCVPAGQPERLASMYGSQDITECDAIVSQCYMLAMQGVNRLLACVQDSRESHPTTCSVGNGPVSTASDYLRFCQMLLNQGPTGRHSYPEPQDGGADGHQPLTARPPAPRVAGRVLARPGYGLGLGY